MVRPDYCAVDHLQTGVAAAAVVERFAQQLPQARQRPAPELAVNRRPFAEVFMPIAPRNARSRNPENPIQSKAMIPRTTTTARTPFNHEGLQTGPLLVAHQTPDRGGLLNSHLESELTRFGNPFCQHVLVAEKPCGSTNNTRLLRQFQHTLFNWARGSLNPFDPGWGFSTFTLCIVPRGALG
jgi:hypothetical protein